MNMYENKRYEDNNIRKLVESKTYQPLNESQSNTMTSLLQNTEREQTQLINEATVSKDVAAFLPILMPVIRTVYPRLIANELLGVQPLSTPSTFIYSFLNNYAAKPHLERVKLALYKLDKPATEEKDDDIDGETIIHKEGNYVLVTVKGDRKKAKDTFGAYTVEETYSNSTVFPRILKNYSEADMSDELRPDINHVNFTITKKSVSVGTRALHGTYSTELYQDLQAQFGIRADKELIDMMSNEIQTDIDADVIRFVKQNSRQLPDWDAAQFANRTTVEKARELYFKIQHEASRIAQQTYRGVANVVLCSPRVANLLASLNGFVMGPVESDLSRAGVLTGFVGTIDGRLRVVVDPYSFDDYVTVLYKGSDRHDAMGYFCPYVPLTFTAAINHATGTNDIIAKTRYALTTIPGIATPDSNDRAMLYASTFSVTGI